MTEIVYMHIFPLGLGTIILGVLSVMFWVMFAEKGSDPFWNLIWALVCTVFGVWGLIWWIGSACTSIRPEYVSTHPIKEVVWPDGTKEQMISCDGQQISVTSRFHKVVDEKIWQVKRTRYSPIFWGVSWSGTIDGDHFTLAKIGEATETLTTSSPSPTVDQSPVPEKK